MIPRFAFDSILETIYCYGCVVVVTREGRKKRSRTKFWFCKLASSVSSPMNVDEKRLTKGYCNKTNLILYGEQEL